MIKKIFKYFKHPQFILLKLDAANIIRLDDKHFVSLFYQRTLNKKLNLENPITFNEKLQWLKLYDRKDIYTKMVDKYEAKKYVSSIIGEEYIIPTLGLYDKFEDIDFEKLPNQFVIKCTHDSGGLIIVKDKSKLDINKAKKKINKSLKKNYYYAGREWPYKNVKPRIIIEKYLEDNQNKVMRDYKFFCFNGSPYVLYVSEGLENHETAQMSFFDMNFKLSDCRRKDYKPISRIIDKPVNFEKMKDICSKLSKNISHLRVDLYEINNKIYFGELTFYTNSGCIPFESDEWDKKLGDLIILPKDDVNEK